MSRPSRKIDHIKHALETGQRGQHGFEDVKLVHNCLPDLNVKDIQIHTTIGGLTLSSPIVINAMTGGAEQTFHINQKLAQVAKEKGLAMAVGSQMAAIKDPSIQHTYRIVRQENPKGIIFANLGAEATIDQAKQAVDMLEANALQIHLNVVQELVMPEGDRNFKDALQRIEQIVLQIGCPVIVKEVGFGISAEAARRLQDIGVKIVDVGGFGGTNFSRIENRRRKAPIEAFDDWGIRTVPSLVEVLTTTQMDVIASGGIRTSLEIVKALALGARAVGIAGYFLKLIEEHGTEKAIEAVDEYHEQIIKMMCALGVRDIPSFSTAPVIISGESYHWLTLRGIPVEQLAQRQALHDQKKQEMS